MTDSYQFKAHERPLMAGSPATPDHPIRRMVWYGIIGTLVGLTAGLTNGLMLANLPQIQGFLGLTPEEGGWIQVSYYMFSAIISVMLFKIRQNFGLTRFVRYLIIGLIGTNCLQFFFHSYHTELIARGMSGLVGGSLNSLAMYYMMQALPPIHRGKGMVLGLGLTQLSQPLARFISPLILHHEQFQLIFSFQAGLALMVCASVWLLPIPPGFIDKTFEKLDLISFPLMATGIACISSAATQGRIVWWDKSWIGWLLVVGFTCCMLSVIIEYNRKNPMFDIKWMLHGNGMLQVAIFGSLIRMALSEQNMGAAGLLTAVGMGADQMVHFYMVTTCGAALGLMVSFLTFKPTEIKLPLMLSFTLIAIASFMEIGQNQWSRPVNFYIPEFMISFASLYFFGPVMMEGILRAMAKGPAYIMSFSAVFGFSQTVGGLIGSAILNAFLTIRTRMHLINGADSAYLTDPMVNQLIQNKANAVASMSTDTTWNHAYAVSQVVQQDSLQAQLAAYNDLFVVVGGVSLVCGLIVGLQWWWYKAHHTHPLEKELKAFAQLRQKAIQGPPPIIK
ncbi:MFS transporter [Neisseriaceae bacterium ESL0693]|nr:MFS transporter [Neisseriaceae bacterium ESL0693]